MNRRHTPFMSVVLLGMVAQILSAHPAQGVTNAPPELLFVVDTSQSMQYRVGSDTAPICGSTDPTVPDEKSRWNIAREIIGGSFAGFTCQNEALAAVPEAVNPPTQLFGTPVCIPGLGMTLSTPVVTRPALSGYSVQSRTFPTDASGPDDIAASYQTKNASGTYTVRTMWMRFDFSSVNSGAAWAAAQVDIPGVLYNASGSTSSVQLVLSPYDPPTTGQNLCQVLQAGAQVVSGPITLPATTASGTSTTLSIPLTTPGTGWLESLRKSGATSATLFVVPAGITLDGACSTFTGTPQTDVQFVPSATLGNSQFSPSLTVAEGTPCPAEGPPTHSIGLGMQGDGSTASVPAVPDGLMDVYGGSVKFALLAGDNIMNKGQTQVAGFSFAADISSLWGTINMGLADPYLPGTVSVPVTGPDDMTARAATYNAIQAQLALIRPNGPTPLAAQLADAQAYFGPGSYHDPHFTSVAQDPVSGDPYFGCRTHMVVVISDGGANLYDGSSDGRSAAIQTAAALFSQGVQVQVLAVGWPTGAVPTDPNFQFLNDLAVAGGSGAAHVVASADDAVAALAAPIAGSALQGEVLTRPVFTTSTGAVGDVQHSFQTVSIFDLSQPLRTRGVVEQRIFRCDASCKSDLSPSRAQVCSIVNYQDRLKNRTIPRRVYTHLNAARVNFDSAHVSAFDLGIATVGLATKYQLMPDLSCATVPNGYDLSTSSQRNAYRDEVLATARGDAGTCRANHPLGAPSRAQPALLEPAIRLPYKDPTFKSYANTPAPTSSFYTGSNPPGSLHRPTMLFVATHEGLLHAFRTDADTTITTQDGALLGDEMWSFMPRFTLTRLPQMKLVTSADASFLGAPVTAQHVLLKRDFSAGTTAASTAANWRAVVIVGAGEAGSGYTALDVTAPDDPRVMWEIAPDHHCWGDQTSVTGTPGPRCVNSTKFAQMGRSTARAVISTLYLNDGSGIASERAVAILPFGKPASASATDNLGVEGTGQRGVYIVDLANGDILRKFVTADLGLSGFPYAVTDTSKLGYPWSTAGCYNNAIGQIATRCFVGDSRGVVWRLDLSSPDPTQWDMRFFSDLYGDTDLPPAFLLPLDSADRAPIQSPPSISTTSAGTVQVITGTGDGDIATNSTKRDVVVSLKEAYHIAADGTALPPLGEVTWAKQFDAGERFIGPPLVFANYAFWSTYVVAAAGLCEDGTARLWGARFDRRQSTSDPTDTFGAFPDPQKPADQSKNLDYQAVGKYKPSPVDLQPEPACTAGCPPNNPSCVLAKGAALGGGSPKYELSVAVVGNVQSAYQTPKDGNAGTASVGSIAITPPQPRSAAVITGWDLLLD